MPVLFAAKSLSEEIAWLTRSTNIFVLTGKVIHSPESRITEIENFDKETYNAHSCSQYAFGNNIFY